jgi:hypothetical protein
VTGRPAWRNSDRRKLLPPNWPALRADADRRNPEHICWQCGRPGGEALDHKDGDPLNNAPDNLDWIHDWRSVKAGRVERNCHAQKTRDDRPSVHRVEKHPAL